MTGRGIAFAGFFALLLSAAKLTGSREIGLTALSLGLILAYSLVSALWTACCVRYRVEIPSFGLIRGESASFTLYVRGFRLFPAVLYLQASLNDCTFPRCAFQLKLGEREQAFQVPVDCPHHGIWQMQLRRLKVRDLFGLFSTAGTGGIRIRWQYIPVSPEMAKAPSVFPVTRPIRRNT